jgi:predicted dehydrogenase
MEKAMSIRIIQVGMGDWGRNWYQNVLSGSTDVSVVACVDNDPAMLALARQKLHVPSERCFPSFEAALTAADADAVLVTATLPAHVPVALKAIAAGKHVLLEKPFAPTLADAQQVVAAAATQGCVLMISQNYRFFPAPRIAAALVREGRLGPVGAISIDFRRYANAAPREGHRHYTIAHPLLMDMTIHHLDLLRMVLGREPRSVTCHTWNPPWSNFRDPAATTATITFADGPVVSYRGSWVSPAPQTAWAGEWHMECAGGEIVWTSRGAVDASADRVAVRRLGKTARRVALPDMAHVDRAGSLAAFVKALETGQEPGTSGRDNLGSIALMRALIESAASGLPTPVPQVTA